MQKKCVRCGNNPASSNIIVDGVYYKDICQSCRFLLAPIKVSSGHARWERDIDIIDHEADIQQPYNSDGTINAGFAKLYPKQASVLFSPEQLRRANM